MGQTQARVKTRHPGIYRRGNRYSVRFTDASGRQRFRSAPTVEQARQLRATLLAVPAEADLGRQRFDAFARDWIATYQGRTGRGIREATRQDYANDLEQWAIPYLGRRRLFEITLRI